MRNTICRQNDDSHRSMPSRQISLSLRHVTRHNILPYAGVFIDHIPNPDIAIRMELNRKFFIGFSCRFVFKSVVISDVRSFWLAVGDLIPFRKMVGVPVIFSCFPSSKSSWTWFRIKSDCQSSLNNSGSNPAFWAKVKIPSRSLGTGFWQTERTRSLFIHFQRKIPSSKVSG